MRGNKKESRGMSRNAGDREKKDELFFLNLALFGPWSWEQSGARGDKGTGRGKLSTRGCGLPYPLTRGSWILERAC